MSSGCLISMPASINSTWLIWLIIHHHHPHPHFHTPDSRQHSFILPTFPVLTSHPACLITVQKISPDGKAKIQLQVVLHDGGASTFHFNSPEGEPAQRQDRDKVKELLQTLLPKFKRKVNKELEEKERWVRLARV